MPSCIQALVWLVWTGVLLQSAGAGVCDADLNHDGAVNTLDLGTLLASWTLPPARACTGPACAADLSGDGLVNTLDLGQLLVAWGMDCTVPPAPRVIITPVAHSHDPAPGIPFPGAFLDVLLTPQIDADGNVFFKAFIGAPGLGELGNQALFYGQPGNIHKLIWETEPAPHFPAGVTIRSLFGTNERLCEAGIVSFGATLQGPGVTAGVNDMAIFVGDPRIAGDIRPILQTGDQAPGLDPGMTVNYDFSGVFFGAEQSDNGTLMVFSRLQGPGVTVDNDYAFWTGTRDNLQLVWRNGMHAPGTPTGVTFTWADFVTINDSGLIGFRGTLSGPGIVDGMSDRGQWSGGPGSLQVVAWTGVPGPELPPSIAFSFAFGGLTCINALGDMNAHGSVDGPGITSFNDEVICAGPPGQLQLVAREGDAVPVAGDDISIDNFGRILLNAQQEAFFNVQLRGRSLAGQSRFAAFFGSYRIPMVALLDGAPAPNFPPGIVLAGVTFSGGWAALNDVGDLVTVTKIQGAGVTPETDVVVWLHRNASQDWIPLLRGDVLIDGRTTLISEPTDVLGAFWQSTGGSDGFGLSFNDAGQLSMRIEFTDGSHGVYVLRAMAQGQ